MSLVKVLEFWIGAVFGGGVMFVALSVFFFGLIDSMRAGR